MRRIVAIVALAVVAAIVVGGYLFYRDAADADAQSTASALQDYRPDAAPPGLERPGVPAQGVYELLDAPRRGAAGALVPSVEREDAVDVGGESVPVVVIRSTQTISGEYDWR